MHGFFYSDRSETNRTKKTVVKNVRVVSEGDRRVFRKKSGMQGS